MACRYVCMKFVCVFSNLSVIEVFGKSFKELPHKNINRLSTQHTPYTAGLVFCRADLTRISCACVCNANPTLLK